MEHPCSLPVLFALAVITASTPLQAQSVGDRVRVSVSGNTYVGEVTAVSDGGFELGGGRWVRSIDYAGIQRLERSTGTRSLWKKGLVYGAAAGAGAGVLYGVLVSGTCEVLTVGTANEECNEVGIQVALVAGAAWGAIGGGLGMGVGALFRTEAWTTIPLGGTKIAYTPMIQPRVGPDGHFGLSLGMRIRF